MILAYSRYLYLRFYPRQSLEFFLEGHIEAYREMGGVARRHRYDNIKTVVIERSPELKFNAQFLDFARHFGFSIHLCNPYRANEKGRIERALRDLRDWLRVNRFEDLNDLTVSQPLADREESEDSSFHPEGTIRGVKGGKTHAPSSHSLSPLSGCLSHDQ